MTGYQTKYIVRDISRDDRARIATYSLRNLTDRLKENYSVDYLTSDAFTQYCSPVIVGSRCRAKMYPAAKKYPPPVTLPSAFSAVCSAQN